MIGHSILIEYYIPKEMVCQVRKNRILVEMYEFPLSKLRFLWHFHIEIRSQSCYNGHFCENRGN